MHAHFIDFIDIAAPPCLGIGATGPPLWPESPAALHELQLPQCKKDKCDIYDLAPQSEGAYAR